MKNIEKSNELRSVTQLATENETIHLPQHVSTFTLKIFSLIYYPQPNLLHMHLDGNFEEKLADRKVDRGQPFKVKTCPVSLCGSGATVTV